MADTLQDFERIIKEIEDNEFEERIDGDGPLAIASPSGRCTVLHSIAAKIRRIAWAEPYRLWARDTACRAEEVASQIGREHGLRRDGTPESTTQSR